MSVKIKMLKVITIVLLPAFLQAFSWYRAKNRVVKEIKIDYLGDQNMYITNEEIFKLLKLEIYGNRRNSKGGMQVKWFEDRLDGNPMLETSDVYLTLDGILKAKVKQREPIVRVFSGGKFYYLDSQGQNMPLSKSYSARVPIVVGNVTAGNTSEVFAVSKHIYNDEFLLENITEIQVMNTSFRLKMRIADFDVVLGDTMDLKLKFNNLKAFYKKASKDNILDAYKQISLKYSNQVVCTKK